MAKILVIDDRPDNRRYLVKLLRYRGHQMLEAHDGAEGLETARAEMPDLVISDILMPTMDGFSLVRYLRQDNRLAHIPVVFYTATYHVEQVRDLALACGVRHIIEKPSRPEAVFRIVDEALGLKPAPQSAAPPEPIEEQRVQLITGKLYEQLDIKGRRLAAIIDHTLELSTERDSQLVLNHACRDIREILGARIAVLRILDEAGCSSGDPIVYGADAGAAGRFLSTGFRQQELEEAVRARRSFRVPPPGGSHPDMDPAAIQPQPSPALLAVPILSPSRVYGWICLIDKLGEANFSDADERMASVLGAQVGRIYENGSLYEAVQRHMRELEQEMAERKRLEQQLQHAQKMEAVGRLAGGVAHDFNNLLTVINGYGEMLAADYPPSDPARELLTQIVVAGNRAAGLTRQLLAFSRKAIIEPRILDLKAVVVDVDKMLRRIVGEDIHITVSADPDAGAVKADAGQIEQVLLNLVVNARDAMPQGGQLTIEIRNVELDETYCREHAEAQAGPYVLLAVTDTGCGMDAATLNHAFEPFFTTKGERGTGLGLATLHGIVKQAGGHVGVYSEVGQGTTFKIYLPRIRQRPSGKSLHAAAAMPTGTETVLLVEDDEGVRALAQHVLAACGYTILPARDGAEAVRIAEQHTTQIDLLLTDVVMPRTSGPAVAEQLVVKHSNMKVLYSSGYTDDAVVRHGMLQAGVAFLQKPYSPSALAIKVREVLDSGPSEPP